MDGVHWKERRRRERCPWFRAVEGDPRAVLVRADASLVMSSDVNRSVDELREALLVVVPEVLCSALPDGWSLRAAFVADGGMKSWMQPPFEPCWYRMFGAILVAFEKAVRFERRHFGVSFPKAAAWLVEHAAFFVEARRCYSAVRRVVDAAAVVDALLARAAAKAEAEAEARAKVRHAELMAQLAVEDAERRAVRDARFRPWLLRRYDAARLAGEIQGFVEMKAGFFVHPRVRARPRWLYVLLGADGAMYGGSTNDLRRRVRQHRDGAGAAVTRLKPQRWFLLYAERFADGAMANCAEAALLASRASQDALLGRAAARAVRLHDRFGVLVPWLALGQVVPDPEVKPARIRKPPLSGEQHAALLQAKWLRKLHRDSRRRALERRAAREAAAAAAPG